MKPGFIPALGTPLDPNGELVADSLRKHIKDQIKAGAVGLLCMGSMGIEAFIRDDVYPEVARVAVEAADGQVPVFIGAMDTSLSRLKKRIAALEALDVAGIVLTAPYYTPASRVQMMNFFRGAASLTRHKLLVYDLPVITQAKITFDMVKELLRAVPNFAGIKSADTAMFRKLKLDPEVPKDFITVYSGLDTFDIAYKWGLDNCLDGMLSCTPVNTEKLFAAMKNGDFVSAAGYLDNIVALRDCFLANDLMPAFSYSMNLLGCEGNFAQDYMCEITPQAKENVRKEMIRIGELPV